MRDGTWQESASVSVCVCVNDDMAEREEGMKTETDGMAGCVCA